MYNLHSSVYNIQCTLYKGYSSVYSLQCTVYTVHSSVYSLPNKQSTIHSTQYSVHCIDFPVGGICRTLPHVTLVTTALSQHPPSTSTVLYSCVCQETFSYMTSPPPDLLIPNVYNSYSKRLTEYILTQKLDRLGPDRHEWEFPIPYISQQERLEFLFPNSGKAFWGFPVPSRIAGKLFGNSHRRPEQICLLVVPVSASHSGNTIYLVFTFPSRNEEFNPIIVSMFNLIKVIL